MTRSDRRALRTFVVVSSLTGSGMAAAALSLTTPATGALAAFAGGFGGTLLAGAALPRVRRHVLETFRRLGNELYSQPPSRTALPGFTPRSRQHRARLRPKGRVPERQVGDPQRAKQRTDPYRGG